MSDKDIYTIIQSYLTLQELHQQLISNVIDNESLIRIFKERDLVLVKLQLLIETEMYNDEFISYKLMTRDEGKGILSGLNEMFSTYKYKGQYKERKIQLDWMVIEKQDFKSEIITDYERMISFIKHNEGEYNSYLKLFDIVNDCSNSKLISTYCKDGFVYGTKNNLVFSSITKYKQTHETIPLQKLSCDHCEVLVKCYFRSTVQTKIMTIKKYNECINYIEKEDKEDDSLPDEIFETEPILSKFVKLSTSTNIDEIKNFRNFFGETDINDGSGCLDELLIRIEDNWEKESD